MTSSKYQKLFQVAFGIFIRSRSCPSSYHSGGKSVHKCGSLERFVTNSSQNYLPLCVNHYKIFSRHASTIAQNVTVESSDNTVGTETEFDVETKEGTFHDFLKNHLSEKNFVFSSTDWEILEQKIETMKMNVRSWETKVMGLLLSNKSFDVGKSFLNYIKKQGRKPDYTTLALFISLCGEDYKAHENMDSVIFDTFSEFQQQLQYSGFDVSIYDSMTCRYLINGFYKTSRWKECVEFLDMASIMDRPGTSYISPIVIASLKNGEVETALKYLHIMGERGLIPTDDAFKAFLSHCRHEQHPVVSFKNFSVICNQYSWIPNVNVAALIKEHFFASKESNYSVKETRMNISGTCSLCHQRIKKGGISLDEFTSLQKEYMSKVMVGENIYYKSNPDEFERFKKFLDVYAPFDVVIDGLNVAFHGGKQAKASQLLQVAEYFAVDKKKKVCVVGRKHMLGWQRSHMTRLQKITSCFFAENISKDDQFVLYSTLKSGPYAAFVSIDEMRDSAYLLREESSRRVFKRWQASRQMIVKHVTQQGQVILHVPRKYETSFQSNDRGWHIPYFPPDDGTVKTRPSFLFPNAWMCIRDVTRR